MAIFHCNVSIISRSTSATTITAKAAYRAGEKIYDPTVAETFDYTRKRGVFGSEILLPAGAPAWAGDRSQLWVAVEQKEDQSTRPAKAQLAREVLVALPQELDHQQKQALTRTYVQQQFVAKGMVADIAYHDFNSHNPHAHVLLTLREITPEGFGNKNRSWNKSKLVGQWREQWAQSVNQALERAGHDTRVDHRSLKDQGIERAPQIHLGPKVIEMERKGIHTEVGDIYRAIAAENRSREAVRSTHTPALEAAASVKDAPTESLDHRTLIEQWQQYKDAGLERTSAPAKPAATGQGRSQPKGNYGKYFTFEVRHELGKDYQPPNQVSVDPDNRDVKPVSSKPAEPHSGAISPELAAVLKQAALQSPNSRKQLQMARKTLQDRDHEINDWWTQRGGYYGTAKREYLKELARQVQRYGNKAVLTPQTDQAIAVKLRVAGYSWNSIFRAVSTHSPVATSLPSAEHQSAYLEQVIKPCLQAPQVKTQKEVLRQELQGRHQGHEMRLDKLGLATEVKRDREVELER
jgi:hypothetical protein